MFLQTVKEAPYHGWTRAEKPKRVDTGDHIKGAQGSTNDLEHQPQDTWSGQVISDLRFWEGLFPASSAPPPCSPGKWAGAMGATALLTKSRGRVTSGITWCSGLQRKKVFFGQVSAFHLFSCSAFTSCGAYFTNAGGCLIIHQPTASKSPHHGPHEFTPSLSDQTIHHDSLTPGRVKW